MKKNTTLERLLKVGSFTELFGLIRGYRLETVMQKIKVWGLVGQKFWTKDSIETVLAPYRNHTKQQNLSEKNIDETLQNFAKTVGVDLNLVRRIFYQVGVVEKPEEKPEEIIEEAEDDLPEFDEDSVAEETEEESD